MLFLCHNQGLRLGVYDWFTTGLRLDYDWITTGSGLGSAQPPPKASAEHYTVAKQQQPRASTRWGVSVRATVRDVCVPPAGPWPRGRSAKTLLLQYWWAIRW